MQALDPARGTGNFLYIAPDAMKQLESEVVALDAQMAASVGVPTELAFEWGIGGDTRAIPRHRVCG